MTVTKFQLPPPPPEEIQPECLYSLREAMQRTGWGKSGMRAARRAGLPVKYVGRKAYLLGRDIIDYIQRNGRTER